MPPQILNVIESVALEQPATAMEELLKWLLVSFSKHLAGSPDQNDKHEDDSGSGSEATQDEASDEDVYDDHGDDDYYGLEAPGLNVKIDEHYLQR